MSIKAKLIFSLFAFTSVLFLFQSCGNSSSDSGNTEATIEQSLEVEIDTAASKLIMFNNVLFSLPSPYQFAFFIKNLGITYNKEYLNRTSNSSEYTTTFEKALNVGVYGTDLGYLNIYEQTPEAVNYFSALKMLSQDIGISNTFDAETIERIENNMGNKDSLLYIISNKYREADAFLKDNDRNHVAVLILAGGWIESLDILCKVAKDYPSDEITQKIAEQKHPLENLINILQPYYNNSKDYKVLIDMLIELAYVYDGVDYKYTYKEPETDAKKKITYINSETSLIITSEQLKEIKEKIAELRLKVVKQNKA